MSSTELKEKIKEKQRALAQSIKDIPVLSNLTDDVALKLVLTIGRAYTATWAIRSLVSLPLLSGREAKMLDFILGDMVAETATLAFQVYAPDACNVTEEEQAVAGPQLAIAVGMITDVADELAEMNGAAEGDAPSIVLVS